MRRVLLYVTAASWDELMGNIETIVQQSGGSPISVSHTVLTVGNDAAFSAIVIVEGL